MLQLHVTSKYTKTVKKYSFVNGFYLFQSYENTTGCITLKKLEETLYLLNYRTEK